MTHAPITIVVKGENHLSAIHYAIFADSTNLTIQGDGTLNFSQTSNSANGINCGSLTIQGAVSVTGNCNNAVRDIYCPQSLTVDTTGTVTAPKISSASKGTFTYKQGNLITSSVFAGGGCQISGDYTWPGDHIFQSDLTVAKGVTLTIPKGKSLTASAIITNDGEIVNNGTIVLPTGTDAAAIKNMGISLTENGLLKVGHQYYFNDGTKVVTTTLNFTKSAAEGNWNESATVDTDGYQWDKTTNTLKLGGLYLSTENTDGIDVPAGTTIELQSGTSSIIKSGSAGSYSIGIDCYGGSDPLTITGSGTLDVTAGEASGGTVTATGGTAANAKSLGVYAAGNTPLAGGTLSITDGTLNAKGDTAALWQPKQPSRWARPVRSPHHPVARLVKAATISPY